MTESGKNPNVIIKTSMGDIKAEIFENETPITAKNFLKYVDEGLLDGTSFYRTVKLENQPLDTQPSAGMIKIEVIQGGTKPAPKGSEEREKIGVYPSTYPPIEHETTQTTGMKHVDGSLSMARGDPGTATSSFFVVINEQPQLDYGGMRNPDGQGFASFGIVREGMDVVRNIQSQPDEKQKMKTPVDIISIKRE